MIHKSDPLGKAILDYMDGSNTPDIQVESNITENEIIPVEYLFRSYDQMPEKEQFALSLAGGRILDVGAGSGAHALALQKLNKEVVALDWSGDCCEAMKKQGVEKVINSDFYQYNDENKYDTLLLMMNGFGIAGTLENLEAFLLKCKSLLKPGGILIGESVDILYMFEEEDEEGSYLIDLNANYYGELEYKMSYKKETSDWFPWLYVSMDIVIDAAEKVGFEMVDFYQGEESDFMVCLKLQ